MRRLALALAAIAFGAGPLLTARQEIQTLPKPAAPAGARDAAPSAPTAPAGTGVIAGTLVAADTGRPVRRAQVTLSGGDVRTNKSATTDERGQFSFTALPTGDFTLSASKGGFLGATFGQQKPGTGQAGTLIHLLAGQRIERLSFPIMRGGVITGVVTDEFGDPAFGTTVRAMRYSWRTGERTLQSAGTGSTDDRGVYRIPALPPGEYIVSAVPRETFEVAERMRAVEEMAVVASRGGSAAMMEEAKMLASRISSGADAPEPTSGYAPVYFPGTTQASGATTFMLAASEERANVDVQLQLVPLVTLTGTVVSPQPGTTATLQLVDRTQPPGTSIRSTRSAPDGTFTITGVAPGQYTLFARATVREGAPPPMPGQMPHAEAAAMEAKMAAMDVAKLGLNQLWASTEVVVDGRNRPTASLVLQAGMAVSGVVKFEGGATPAPAPAQLARMSVTLAPVGAVSSELTIPSSATLDAEGRFTLRGVFPGSYRVVPSAGAPAGYTIRSSVFAGRDSLDFPLEVKPGEDHAGGVLTFSTSSGEVSGALQDAGGTPAPGYTVLIFATDMRYWTPQSRRIQTARPSTTGRFTLRNLPAGDYRIVAVTDVEQGQWFDPTLLRQLVGASIAITLADGEKRTQDLRIR